MKSVLVGMSGGVDSSVAALLLKEDGYKVIGYTLKFGEDNNKCCKVDDAALVCAELGIEYRVIEIYEEFEKNIVQYFINGYLDGNTPSPCPHCNMFKFGVGIEYAVKENIDYVATGHYARIIDGKLYTADTKKDQAYFLSRLPKKFFNRILLPLGTYKKEKIREIATRHKLHIAQKADSQDICFVQDDYRDFLRKRDIKKQPGNVIDVNGNKIAEHDGYFNFTLGQRFKMGGFSERMYVLKKNTKENTITIGQEKYLFSNTFRVKELNIISEENPIETDFYVKVRSRDKFHKAKSIVKNGEFYEISLENKVRAVNPGQLCVLYKKETEKLYQVLGSGWIISN